MKALDLLGRHAHRRLDAWRAREALSRTARYRVAERTALRRALTTSSLFVAALLLVGALVSTVMDPLVGGELLILNGSAAVVSLLIVAVARGRGRRHSSGIAVVWAILMAADLLVAGLTSPLQLRNSAMIMPAIPLVYALVMPWTTRVHVIAVAWTMVAALILTFALERSGVDPVSPIVLSAVITGAISVAGHIHRRAERIDAFDHLMQIRTLHLQGRVATRRLRLANHELASSARLDPLTRAGNRLGLDEDLRSLEADGELLRGSVGFVMVDLDRFKSYNDRHGHIGGDWVLRRVADTIAGSIRITDRVYRYGGEELLVLLADVDEISTDAIVGRMLAAVQDLEIPHPENRPWQVVTASAGWATYRPGGGASTAAAVTAADEALYQAKRLGRNRAFAHRHDRADISA